MSSQDRGKIKCALRLERQVAAVSVPCLLGSLTHYRADVLQGQLCNARYLAPTLKQSLLSYRLAISTVINHSDVLVRFVSGVGPQKLIFRTIVRCAVPACISVSRYVFE